MRRLGRIREQQPAVSQPGRASRYSKVVTWIAIPCTKMSRFILLGLPDWFVGSIFYAVFIQDWGPHEHVFSGVSLSSKTMHVVRVIKGVL